MDARLKAIYDELPEVPCTGLCFEGCAHIGTYPIERRTLKQAGARVPRVEERPCPLLDFAGRCTAHEVRPVICRLYGATEELRCEHGCVPERWLSGEEARAYMARVKALLPFKPGEDDALVAGLISGLLT